MLASAPKFLRLNGFAGSFLALALWGISATPLLGQNRLPASSEVIVSRDRALLTLEFTEGPRFSAELREGVLLLDRQRSGSYTPGDALDRSWRSLLAEAIAASPEASTGLLTRWVPPSSGELTPEATATGATLARAIAEALTRDSMAEPANTLGDLEASDPSTATGRLLRRLLDEPELAESLNRLLGGRSLDDLRVHLGESVAIPEEERVEGSLLLVDGALTLDGVVGEDLLLLRSRVRLGELGSVGGDLRYLEGSLEGDRSAVQGRIVELFPATGRDSESSARSLGEEIRSEVRRGIEESRTRERQQAQTRGALRNVLRGAGGVAQTALGFLLLLGIGALLLHFFAPSMERVAETVRRAPGRSLLMGWAGLLLSPLAWVAGIVLLAVSILGIPFLLLWIPFFWFLWAIAITAGTLAVSRELGRWWVERGSPTPERLDPSQPLVQLGIGLLGLLSFFFLANLLRMGGSFFGFFAVLIGVTGALVALNAGAAGLGAVLLSRGGRRVGAPPAPELTPEPTPEAEGTSDPEPTPEESEATPFVWEGDPETEEEGGDDAKG